MAHRLFHLAGLGWNMMLSADENDNVVEYTPPPPPPPPPPKFRMWKPKESAGLILGEQPMEAGGGIDVLVQLIVNDTTMAAGDDILAEQSMEAGDGIDELLALTTTVQDFVGEQYNESKSKIIFGGISYKCNKVMGKPEIKGTIKTYYSCEMVLYHKEGEKWQPLQVWKCSLAMKDNPTEASLNKKQKNSELTFTKCNGTMHGFFYDQEDGDTSYPRRKQESYSHTPSWAQGIMMDQR
jgi:hypothetical protein